jgi:hypothetical protein
MLRNPLFTVHVKRPNTPLGNGSNGCAAHQRNLAVEATIDNLYNNSRSGLRGVLIFLAASAIAFYFNERSLAGSLPDNVMEQLGSTPPVFLINCVLGASTLSALISISGRIYFNRKPGKTLAYL